MVVRIIESSICFRSPDNLEVVSVQMERMLAGIVIVEDNFHNLALLKDKGVCVAAIDCGIGGGVTSGEDGV